MTSHRRWLRWVGYRFLLAVPVVAGVTLLTFTLIHVAPGDPIYLLAGDGGSPAYYADMRAKYGLDQPVAEQFVRYARAVLTLDLGYSFMYQAPVARVVFEHAPVSLLLGATALALAMTAGVALGALCVLLRSRLVDGTVRLVASLLYAAPVFWTGQILMLVFAVKLGLVPVAGMSSTRADSGGVALALDVGRHLVLPAVTLSLPLLAIVARVTRASTLETLREPFVRGAAARGLTHLRVVAQHVLPNACMPIVALVGQHASQLLVGAALTESLFGWPGMGYLVFHASVHRDYPLVTGAFILISVAVVLGNALTDAVSAWLDPRIRLG